MRLIVRTRRLLFTPWQIGIVWLIAGAILLAWVAVRDSFHIRDPIGYYFGMSYLALLVLRQLVIWAIRAAAERISRKRLGAAAPHYRRASAYLEQSKLDKAAGEYASIFSIDPDNARAFTGRGTIHELRGEYALAIADYTAAINMDPFIRGLAHRKSLGNDAGNYDLAWAHHYRGRAHLSKGEFDLARRDFRSAVSVGSVGFPKAVGNAGFLTAISHSNAPPEHHVRSGDSATVHYVKPCGAVRMNADQDFLYSKYYLAVNCNVCLENIPKKNMLRDILGSPLSRAVFPCLFLISPLPGWIIVEGLIEGQMWTWLILFGLAVGFSPLWTDVITEFLIWIARPLASRSLARPFHGGP